MIWLDRLPLFLFIVAALTLGLAPFVPEPHIWEKLKMLAGGTLSRPIDVFDLLLHATPWLLLTAKIARMLMQQNDA
ncbi:RND transporter [Rubripirellula reticaptiva]|uniref:RND transporter n=1 Tax=Rubripirellula reticaptiva TaxID=2528013 RepID=A0A5C6EEW5_9BACT|nr:RND transporter [Rubripirellula reticaptiva]TWU47045.1 hypothetical protein Poly59_60190 [Rubripirellula reticaptiva]